MTKTELRKLMKQELGRHTSEELRQMSDIVCSTLLADDRVGQAETILAFWPMSAEPDIRPLIRRLHAEGKTILLPRVISKTEMEFCPYEGETSMVAVPPYGILEPITDAVDVQFIIHSSGTSSQSSGNARILMLVPGVAFDAEGHRLGHGCGYYDRYLARCPLPTMPVCFPFQMVDVVPTDGHDVVVGYNK